MTEKGLPRLQLLPCVLAVSTTGRDGGLHWSGDSTPRRRLGKQPPQISKRKGRGTTEMSSELQPLLLHITDILLAV